MVERCRCHIHHRQNYPYVSSLDIPRGHWTPTCTDRHIDRQTDRHGGGSLWGLNIRLKGYVYRRRLYSVRQGNGSSTTLPIEVFTQRKFVADFIRLNLNFIHKNDQFGFEPPFGKIRGNVRTSSIARWKARGRLPVREN